MIRINDVQVLSNHSPRRVASLVLACAAVLAIALLGAATARADFGLKPGSFLADSFEQDGTTPVTQAGAHPFQAQTAMSFKTEMVPNPLLPILPPVEITRENTRDIVADLPAGFVGDPQAMPKCPASALTYLGVDCPSDTQVGYILVRTSPGGGIAPPNWSAWGVYNMEAGRDDVARLGFHAGVAARIDLTVRTDGDYGIEAHVQGINNILMLMDSKLVLWGVPADPVHDPQRCAIVLGTSSTRPLTDPVCDGTEPRKTSASAGVPPTAFLTNPSHCADPLTTNLSLASWEHPSAWVHDSYTTASPVTGCEKVPFDPSLKISGTSSTPDSPTGLDVDLHFAQSNNPDGLDPSPLRDAVVKLPTGMTINPGAADGLAGCSDDQLGLGTNDPVSCPLSSRVGTVTAESPALERPMQGQVFLRSQASNDPESGQMFRLALVLRGSGMLIKLPGEVRANAQTGQLEASFRDNPQLPVEGISVELKAGPRALLKTPSACGTYSVQASLTPWSTPTPTELADSFTLDGECAAKDRFTPGFAAGTTNPTGGSYSPFTLRVTRADGQQNVSTIQAMLPEGVLAKLAGVPLCGDADAATGNCPASSQVGSATVGAGAGASPLYVPQPDKAPTAVYLAGPYKGAPYSLVAKVPAQAGPFDLGTVAVRNTIDVDPNNAQVSVKSDPLPQVLGGIPISYRDIRVDVDRSQFTLNPTSCDPMEVRGTIGSAQGTSANVSDRFQVASCEALRFKPKLSLRLSGAPTRRGGYPKLRAVLTMPQHGANIQRAQVLLPKTEFLENAHIRTICTRVQYAAGNGGGKACPKASVYGYAKAWSPLLDQPIQGPVYLRSSNHKLPDLVAALDGQIHIDLVGRIDAVHARIRNTFETVPDAPVSRFVLTMQGGKKGLLVNNTELCKTTPRASVKFDGQNGKIADSKPVTKVACKKSQRKQVRHRRR